MLAVIAIFAVVIVVAFVVIDRREREVESRRYVRPTADVPNLSLDPNDVEVDVVTETGPLVRLTDEELMRNQGLDEGIIRVVMRDRYRGPKGAA